MLNVYVYHANKYHNKRIEVHMNKRNKHLTTTLQHMGHTLGLSDSDIHNAKRTARSMLGITIAAAVAILLIGKIATS